MIRDLKAFGLALAAMLLLGGTAVSAASAQQGEFTTADGNPATLIGLENAEGQNTLTSFGRSVACPGTTYTGHKVNATPKEPVPNKATNITVTPHYNQESCVTGEGQSSTVEMNSCDYEFELGESQGESSGTYGLNFYVRCDTEGDEIHLSTYNNQHHESELLCTTEIPAQGPLTGLHVTNLAGGKVRAHGTLTGTTVTRHGLCVLDGKGTTTSGAELHLDLTVEGENELGGVGLSVSDHESETHEEETGELTTAGGQSVTVIGTQNSTGTNALTAFGATITCPGSTYTGHKIDTTDPQQLVPNKAAEITITPHYNQEKCVDSVSENEATIEMNSCDYGFGIGETEGEPSKGTYGLTMGVVCDTAGDEIHVGLWNNASHEEAQLCTVEVGEQEVGGAHVTDNEDGTLTAAGTLTGLHAERHGVCLLDGKGTTAAGAAFDLDLLLGGLDSEENLVEVGLSD